MISSTAPALLESASTRATDLYSNVISGLDGYGAFTGNSYRSADVFAAAGYASSLPTEAYALTRSRNCNQWEEINTSVPATGNSASALAAQKGI